MDRLRKLAANPRAWVWFYLFGVIRWLALFVLGMTIWRNNVPFLMYISLDAGLTASLAGLGTAFAARKADPEDPL